MVTEGNDTKWMSTFFDYTNKDILQNSSVCGNDSVEMFVSSKSLNQNLTVTFKKSDDFYSLVGATFTTVFSTDTFPNFTAPNNTINTESDDVNLMKTKVTSSYACSVETQLALLPTNGENVGMFLRVAEIQKIQAFPQGNKFGKVSKCFHDQAKPEADLVKITLKDDKNATCAKFTSNMTLDVMYQDYAQNWQMITIPVDTYSLLSSNCTQSTTWFTMKFDNSRSKMNLTVEMQKMTMTSQWVYDDVEDYAITKMMLSFNGDNRYFQNIDGYSKTHQIGSDKLKLHPTLLGYSYQCDVLDEQTISDVMNVTMVTTHWEAFGMNGSDVFSKSQFCPAQQQTTTAPRTTVTATTAPIVPDDPPVSMIQINDSTTNTSCFIGKIGIQLRINYETNKNTTVEKMVNFDLSKQSTIYQSHCNVNGSWFRIGHPSYKEMYLQVQFKNDNTSNFLNEVHLVYTLDHMFPDAKNKDKNVKLDLIDLEAMKIPDGYSYSCNSNETDLLVSKDQDSAVLRLTGLQWQAFGINGTKFGSKSSCFGDTRPTKANVGDWKVKNSTGAVCGRYMMAVEAYVGYTTLIKEDQVVMIPLDNTTLPSSNSKCGNITNDEMSILDVSMDGGKVNFTFSFNSTGDDYNLHVVDFSYDPTSKYFPNHESTKVDPMSNSTLNLFSTPTQNSYKCNHMFIVSFNNTYNRVDISQIQVQPFGDWKDVNGTFSDAQECTQDSDDFNMLIPIIVGIILAVLIVIVLVAYCIGRKRSANQNEYSTI